MILYSDEHTKKSEDEGKWIDSVQYLQRQRNTNQENISLFLKLSVNTWYTLTLDGPVLALKKEEYSVLVQMLRDLFSLFKASFSNCENCQWLFGYMMEVRPDLFLHSGLDYNTIEQTGKDLIVKANSKGNIFAQLLFAMENCSNEEITKCREKVRAVIFNCFDNSQAVDRYFIEVLTIAFE